jgi:2-polyprenyl-3-methyl-5-hydroxy-6-metoxy-1,4-benzoquinol methylase
MESANEGHVEDRRWKHRDGWVLEWHRIARRMVPRGSVLDVSGGDGTFARMLQEDDPSRSVTVTDVSAEALAKASAKGFVTQRVDLAQLPLPFETGAFSSVTLIEVIEHVDEPARLLAEACRVAEGVVVFSVPNFNYLKYRLQAARGRVPTVMAPRNRHRYWFNRGVLERVLREAGVGEVELQPVHAVRWGLRPLFSSLARLWPGLFAQGFVVRCARGA